MIKSDEDATQTRRSNVPTAVKQQEPNISVDNK